MAMEARNDSLLFSLLALLASLVLPRVGPLCSRDSSSSQLHPLLNRSSFPAGFVFGAASSAYQYEGAVRVDGRKPSIWDTFVLQFPEKIADHSNGNIAEEFYYLYKKDVAIMKEIGLDSFRFSFSWPRILPEGKINGGVNQKGVDFYNFLIDELLSHGIQPFVTLFHWDLPQALEEEYGGFLSSKIVDDYRDYVDFCFKQFGAKVKYWATINEPNLFAEFGYATGSFAPGRCSPYIGNCSAGNSATEPYTVAHNMILSHAAAVNLYREKYQASQKGIVGITVQTFWMVPKNPTSSCRKAALKALQFSFGWIIHPMTYGDYPEAMRDLVGDRLPKFTVAEMKMVKGSLDFVGVNYYTARFAEEATTPVCDINLSYTTDSHVNLTTERDGIPIGEQTAASWLYIYPEGIRYLALYVKREYNNLPIIITENGMADPNNSTIPLVAALNDSLRIKFHSMHLSCLLEAIKGGVDIRGYYVWSFLDDFEWELGYTVRFGINYVDYKNGLKRYPKHSAFWFKTFLQRQSVTTGSSLLYSE